MTNQEIAQLARDKGYAAKVEHDRFVRIWLTKRRITRAELEHELDIPVEVMAYGARFDSIMIWGIDS